MTRYVPSRYYVQAGIAAAGFAAFSFWCGLSWAPAYLAAALFLASSAVLMTFGLQPAIEVHDTHLTIGRRVIPWLDIRRIDRAWTSPLLVHITLYDNSRMLLVHAGDGDSAHGLLRQLRRNAREALLDGTPYRRFWGDQPAVEARPPQYRLLLPEDEAEVERLYQRLKTVRSLDPDRPGDEK